MDTSELAGLYLAHRFALLGLSLILVVTVLELMRRGLLKERYALLWLVTAAAAMCVGVFPGIVVLASQWLHLQYLTILVMLTFIFTLGLVLAFSIILSRLSERNRTLAQEVALLSNSLKRLEKRLDA